MTDALYTVFITSLRDGSAHAAVGQFLARIYSDRALRDISHSLNTLPLLLAKDVGSLAARTLRKHLEVRGAEVRLEPQAISTAGDLDLHDLLSEMTDSGTAYTVSRPGHKDRVFYR